MATNRRAVGDGGFINIQGRAAGFLLTHYGGGGAATGAGVPNDGTLDRVGSVTYRGRWCRRRAPSRRLCRADSRRWRGRSASSAAVWLHI